MRSMAIEFEQDMNCRYLDKQYMMGDAFLVAPIFNDKGIAKYYLPEGTWTNYLTGERATGGIWRTENHVYLSIPLWVKGKQHCSHRNRTWNCKLYICRKLGIKSI